jgi:hypothetical protein
MVKAYNKSNIDEIDKMQKEYYKQHNSKFGNVVNIWKINKQKYFDDVTYSLNLAKNKAVKQ